MQALLALETGQIFYGNSIGIAGIRVGEVVFNTALTGYQEILTDPSYTNQLITFTYPHIGNTGINFEDNQSTRIHASGVVIKSLSRYVSNWRSRISLGDFLYSQNVVGIEGIDTRGLVKLLRDNGTLRGCIMAGIIDEKYAIHQARDYVGINNNDLASLVTTKKSYTISGETNKSLNIVVLDFGIKKGILDCLIKYGCNIKVMPANSDVSEILAYEPRGILLSNGPGDPASCKKIIENIKVLINVGLPIFGICLGHQLLALALGARTYKMNFGHHGSNHPVYDIEKKQVLITSQNHGYAVDPRSLGNDIKITHHSLFDNSLQGFKHIKFPLWGFQGHPESAPGPHDANMLFDEFLFAVRNTHAKTREFA